MKKGFSALLVLALVASFMGCGQTVKEGSTAVVEREVTSGSVASVPVEDLQSVPDESAAAVSGLESRQAEGQSDEESLQPEDESGADNRQSKDESSAESLQPEDASSVDNRQSEADSSAESLQPKPESGAEGLQPEPVSGAENRQPEDSSKAGSSEGKEAEEPERHGPSLFDPAAPYPVQAWSYDDEYYLYLSDLETGVLYEASSNGEVAFINDTETDRIVYYETTGGMYGTMPYAAKTLDGLASPDPVGYFLEEDTVRLLVLPVDPKTLDKDTPGVVFVDQYQPGEKIPKYGIFMLVNGGNSPVSIEYKDYEGEMVVATLAPGEIAGFEWLALEGKMRVV